MAPRTRKETQPPGVPNPPPDVFDPPEAASDVDADTETVGGEDAKGQVGDELRHRMISEAAYQLYAERGYVDGLELDDWLQAEAEVDRLLSGRFAAH